MAKTVIVDFTDGAQKPYTGVPDTLLNDTDRAGKEIKARAKKDEPKRVVQTWNVEDGEKFLAPILDAEIDSFEYFPDTFILSKKGKRTFILGKLLKGKGLVAQRGLTEKEIVQNLRNLAINVLDPIQAKYPNMKISSGWRRLGDLKVSVENSDHDIGGAADLQFDNVESAGYIDIANWISKNIPHKQLLLEYRTNNDNSITTWIHIAFILSNGTLVKSAMTIGTLYNTKTYAPGQFVSLA
jgi:hypothetical protein